MFNPETDLPLISGLVVITLLCLVIVGLTITVRRMKRSRS